MGRKSNYAKLVDSISQRFYEMRQEKREIVESETIVENCPFCPLWGNPDVEQYTIGNGVQGDNFFGHPASVAGIACCGACELALDNLPEDEQAWYVAQAQQSLEAAR